MTASPPRLVLDTNVCLDLWLFEEASVRPLADRLTSRTVLALASQALRDELAHVLQRREAWATACPWLAKRPAGLVLHAWDQAHASGLLDERTAPWQAPRCSDPDDQKFIDFAIAAQATHLVTRDKAVLKLKRKLAVWGVTVVTPQGPW